MLSSPYAAVSSTANWKTIGRIVGPLDSTSMSRTPTQRIAPAGNPFRIPVAIGECGTIAAPEFDALWPDAPAQSTHKGHHATKRIAEDGGRGSRGGRWTDGPRARVGRRWQSRPSGTIGGLDEGSQTRGPRGRRQRR